MPPRTAVAFAPAAITNFFQVNYDSSPSPIGATGGGYILSRGTRSRATIVEGNSGRVYTTVNRDIVYEARTTRRAVELLLAETGNRRKGMELDQTVDTPIRAGCGASAASATSAVYAAAAAAGIAKPKRELALFAHRAEILEQTGLGTVSVIYNGTGAGAIIKPGEPGVARFVNVKVPKGTKIVTAFLAPFDKKRALSSKSVEERINRLGREALDSFLADPTLDTLGREGARFSRNLGFETVEVAKLEGLAKSAGALHSSQNMISYAVHAVVDEDRSRRVAGEFANYNHGVRVDTFEVGTERAGVVRASRT